ncbi:MAG: LCP family protein required for cell wall assembly [Candidatus Saccharimonadales bacterium]|jgi:LCP family protein required for cell wall assembly
MSYFRQPKNPKKHQNTMDGFVRTRTNNSDQNEVSSKFRKSYQPEPTTLSNIHESTEGFTTRQSSRSLMDTTSESLEIDDAPERKQKRRFFKSIKGLGPKKKLSTFKRLARSFAVLILATVIGVTSLFTYGYIKARNIFQGNGEGAAALQQNVDPIKLNGEGDGRVNVLLIGKGGPGHEAPDLTDTLLLASIDPLKNEAALVSVPRDMYVQDINGYSTKINAVYSNAKQARLSNSNEGGSDEQAAENAGLDAVKDSISEVLGIPVHYYVMIDFDGFKDAIDTVGGITIDVQEALYDQSMAWLNGGDPLIAGEGLQTFDGTRALYYARSRKGSARGDFDRTERQREVIVALQNKILSLGTFSNPFKVVELLGTFGDKVRTDLNGLEEIKRLYEIGKDISQDGIASVGLADPPNALVRTDNINGLSVVVPSAGLYQYDEIHSYIRNNLRDAFLQSEDARVVILNGTSVTGLATATSNELKSYGYNVTSVDNAPTSTYVNNLLIDNTGGDMRYTKSYLERRLGLPVSDLSIDGVPGIDDADFVIILGTDEVTATTN